MAKKRREKRKNRRKKGSIFSIFSPVPGEVKREIEDFLDNKQAENALEIIDEWLEKRPDNSVLCFYAGSAHAMLEQPYRALSYFRKSYQKDKRNESLLYNLFLLYAQLDFPTHALQILNRYARTELALEEGLFGHMDELKDDLKRSQQNAAVHYDMDLKTLNEVFYWNEETQILQNEGDWNGAIATANKALRAQPNHLPALNNRAMALFYAGRLDEAIADEKQVIERDPQNVHALANLIRFCALNEDNENKATYFNSIRGLSPEDWEDQFNPVAKLLEAYATAGTDREIYDFLDRYASPDMPRSIYMFGAAAANLGNRREASQIWNMINDDDLIWKNLAEQALEALRANKPGLGRADHFPYTVAQELLSQYQLEQITEIIEDAEDNEQQWHQQMASLTTQNPALLAYARWLLWYDKEASFGIKMLMLLSAEAALDELETFAFGQTGTEKERMEAVAALNEAGRLSADQPVRMWSKGEWRDVLLKQFEIGDSEHTEDFPFSEEIADMLEQAGEALQENNLDEAERLYQTILQQEPTCLPAYNNVAQIISQKGDNKTARNYLEKALEIDPNYLMGRCNLANFCLLDDQIDRAEELIAPLVERKHFEPFEMKAYQLSQARIHIAKDDLEGAASILEILVELFPDDPMVEHLKEHLEILQPIGNIVQWVRKRTRQKRERADEKPLDESASLETCLDRHTKDILMGIIRHLGLSGVSALRKAELVNVLAEQLRDTETLDHLYSELSDQARKALHFVINAGGDMSWESFAERHGNDRDEPSYGLYAEPQSPMGILRISGLLFVGTRKGKIYVQIPVELRASLQALIKIAGF